MVDTAVTLGTDAFVVQLQQLLPPGKAWPRSQGSDITRVLEGCAPEFARVQGRADDLLREANPGEANEMLPEHESANGVTASGTVSQRQAALIAKLQDNGAHNPADYTAWAAARGFASVAVRRMPLMPFRCGVARAGDRMRGVAWAHLHIVEYMPDVLVPGSNSFNSWTAVSGSVTANAANGPDGTGTADLLTGSPTPTFTATLSTSAVVRFSVWLKAAAAGCSAQLSTDSDSAFFSDVPTYWRRYVLDGPSVATFVRVAASGDVYAWGAFVGVPDLAFESELLNRQQAHAVPLFRVIGDYPKD